MILILNMDKILSLAWNDVFLNFRLNSDNSIAFLLGPNLGIISVS